MASNDQTGKKPVKTERNERLAAALRANLARRKAQARRRDAQDKPVAGKTEG
jgi:hypothetical protein